MANGRCFVVTWPLVPSLTASKSTLKVVCIRAGFPSKANRYEPRFLACIVDDRRIHGWQPTTGFGGGPDDLDPELKEDFNGRNLTYIPNATVLRNTTNSWACYSKLPFQDVTVLQVFLRHVRTLDKACQSSRDCYTPASGHRVTDGHVGHGDTSKNKKEAY